ncbi:MAG: GbsR/MarR family transcriptional regulator [Omnitrophica WOR_2 bacterium]
MDRFLWDLVVPILSFDNRKCFPIQNRFTKIIVCKIRTFSIYKTYKTTYTYNLLFEKAQQKSCGNNKKAINPDMDINQPFEETHFIEDIGLFFEQMGMPRMAGRILGVLLISEQPAQSISDLALKLKASKSSISIMARLLVEDGLIERVASPVPRRDYYRFKPGGWILYMRQWLGLMSALHQITERGLHLKNKQNSESKDRLQEAHDVFSFIEQEFPALLKTLEKRRGTFEPVIEPDQAGMN